MCIPLTQNKKDNNTINSIYRSLKNYLFGLSQDKYYYHYHLSYFLKYIERMDKYYYVL